MLLHIKASVTNLLCERSKIAWLLFALLWMLLFSWRVWYLSLEADLRFIQVRFSPPSTSPVQLFYDQGYGFNPHDSVVVVANKDIKLLGLFAVSGRLGELVGGAPEGSLRFQITPQRIYGLKLQQTRETRSACEDICIVDGVGSVLRHIESFVPHSNKSFHYEQKIEENAELICSMSTPLHIHEQCVTSGIPVLRFLVEGLALLFCVWLISTLYSMLHCYWKTSAIFQDSEKTKQMLNWCIFVSLTVVYFWFYVALNDHIFPLFFWKVHLAIIFLLSIYYIKTYWNILKLNTITYLIFCYYIIVMISAVIRYFALNRSGSLDLLAFNNGVFHGVLVDRAKQISSLFDIASNTDQSLFIYIFPALLLISFGVFYGNLSLALRKILLIPCIAIPNLVGAWFVRDIFVTDGLHGVTFFQQGIVEVRIFCLFIIQLSVLSLFLVNGLFVRLFFGFLAFVAGWVAWVCYGRGALLGLIMFVMSFPLIYLWVHRDNISVRRMIQTTMITVFLCVFFSVGFAVPRFHREMKMFLPENTVRAGHDIITGFFDDKVDADPARSNMSRQAVLLIKKAPLGGWGPGAFQANADRMRLLHGEGIGLSHSICNIYLLMATNYGLPALLVFSIVIIQPILLALQVKEKVRDMQSRWALGILMSSSCIMLLLFVTNSFLGIITINWIYSIFLGYLLAVAFRHSDYMCSIITHRTVLGIGALCVLIATAGSYITSWGRFGYSSVADDLTRSLTDGYSAVSSEQKIFDNQIGSIQPKVSTRLIATRPSPWRLAYTTSEYLVDYGQMPLPDMSVNGVYRIRLHIEKGNDNFLFLQAQVYVDGVPVDKYSFTRDSKNFLFYQLPGEDLKKVSIHLWGAFALPYHQDMRHEIAVWPYMATHPEFRQLAIQVYVQEFT